MMDRTWGIIVAAMAPWRTLDPISMAGLWAAAHSPEATVKPATRDQHQCERQGVAGRHPLQGCVAGVQVLLDVGQGEEHDAGVQQVHEGRDQDDRQRRRAPPVGPTVGGGQRTGYKVDAHLSLLLSGCAASTLWRRVGVVITRRCALPGEFRWRADRRG
jgi:hypothetical protein